MKKKQSRPREEQLAMFSEIMEENPILFYDTTEIEGLEDEPITQKSFDEWLEDFCILSGDNTPMLLRETQSSKGILIFSFFFLHFPQKFLILQRKDVSLCYQEELSTVMRTVPTTILIWLASSIGVVRSFCSEYLLKCQMGLIILTI